MFCDDVWSRKENNVCCRTDVQLYYICGYGETMCFKRAFFAFLSLFLYLSLLDSFSAIIVNSSVCFVYCIGHLYINSWP